jgi:beta-lactamase class A
MAGLQNARDRLDRLVTAGPGTVGLVVKDLTTGDTLAWSPDRQFPAASLIKIPILITALRQAEAEPGLLGERIAIPAVSKVGGFGILKDLASISSASLLDLLTLMIIISDNTATNLCLDRLGMAAVTDTIAALGLARTVLQRKMMDLAARDRGLDNFTSAADIARALELLATAQILTPAACTQAIGILARQQVKDRLPLLLPAEVQIAHKTGELPGIRHDSGVLQWDGHRVIIAALTQGFPAPGAGLVGGDGTTLIATIGRIVFDAVG